MDKKINFWQFQGTTTSFAGLGIATLMALICRYVMSGFSFNGWENIITMIFGLAFYVAFCLGAIYKNNSNVEKNIKDRQKEL